MENFAVYKINRFYYKISYNSEELLAVGIIRDEPENTGERSLLSDNTYNQLSEYFAGKRKIFDLPFSFKGTEFQNKVWKSLTKIPYGETATYKDIATQIGNPKACRAVGMANNRNPLCIIVPCHRVIGAGGKLVGYAGGLDIKEYLLDLEKKYKME